MSRSKDDSKGKKAVGKKPVDNKAVGKKAFGKKIVDPVVIAVYDQFRKEPLIRKQINQINVSFKDGVVSLHGFVFPPKGSKDLNAGAKRAVEAARKVHKRVKNNLTNDRMVNCPKGQEPCGTEGVCIPIGTQCNLD